MKKTFNKTYEKLNLIMDYIRDFSSRKGYCPSLREIGENLQISTPSLVKYYVDLLEQEGKILRGDPPRRVISLPIDDNSHKVSNASSLGKKSKTFDCPILGKVAAGTPIFAVENVQDYFPLPVQKFNQSTTFMLQIVGDSMIDAGIDDGDIIIVDKEKQAHNGKIVVALLGDSATVKRFYKKDNAIFLHPENQKYSDIIIRPEDDLMILGVVVGSIKSF